MLTEQDTTSIVTTVLYKVLSADGGSCHGGSLTWPLPTQEDDGQWTPGTWVEVAGRLILCENGLHLTSEPASWWMDGASLYVVEYDGEIIGDGSNKVCVRRARLLRQADWSEGQVYLDGEHRITRGLARASGSATVRASGSATVRASGSATVRASGSATVRAYGSATVGASGSATVEASGSATVEASDSATVGAYGSATVRASGSATVEAYGSATVRASGSATVEAYDSATVEAYDSATVEAYDSATVEASDSATVEASDSATVRASDSATVRASGSATVRASGSATVEAYGSATVISDRWHSQRAQVALSHLAAHVDRRGGQLVLRSAETGEAVS